MFLSLSIRGLLGRGHRSGSLGLYEKVSISFFLSAAVHGQLGKALTYVTECNI